jgi:hypothetical protein
MPHSLAAVQPSKPARPIDTLLVRLEDVQSSGKGYRTQCPACGGTSRKLSVCEGDNGAVMMTCFSCHDTPGVLAAIGLTLADLYPQRIKDTTPEGRRAAQQAFKQSAWGAALGVLAREATVLEVATVMIERREPLASEDIERVHVASQRIHQAQEVLT